MYIMCNLQVQLLMFLVARMLRGTLRGETCLGADPVDHEGAGAPAEALSRDPPKKAIFGPSRPPSRGLKFGPPGAPGEAPENPGFLCPKRGPPREFSKQPTVLAYY